MKSVKNYKKPLLKDIYKFRVIRGLIFKFPIRKPLITSEIKKFLLKISNINLSCYINDLPDPQNKKQAGFGSKCFFEVLIRAYFAVTFKFSGISN